MKKSWKSVFSKIQTIFGNINYITWLKESQNQRHLMKDSFTELRVICAILWEWGVFHILNFQRHFPCYSFFNSAPLFRRYERTSTVFVLWLLLDGIIPRNTHCRCETPARRQPASQTCRRSCRRSTAFERITLWINTAGARIVPSVLWLA